MPRLFKSFQRFPLLINFSFLQLYYKYPLNIACSIINEPLQTHAVNHTKAIVLWAETTFLLILDQDMSTVVNINLRIKIFHF